ncbi:M55 family metallopeptidase [Thalassospira sp.]|uniref:M55 family metallopeptidase n=1 Tax=Thalassospira sp. TaxID=1912094 RepID=UPI00273524C4|nr:M55 family metallopeptidase [Thalassospira sp.]MDP2699791.1 M55 family metallopeptidase [Thalassospira sp.]
MRIMISVDIEGVAGVNETIQGRRGNPEYEVARRLMTQEANAAIAGAFDGGATDVIVADSHGPMRNIIAEDLDERARLVSGKPRPLSMIQGIDGNHDGVVLIGYHAAASNYGIMAHTVSGMAFHSIEINGVRAGEPTLFGGYAAEIGVPLLAVSGDDCLAREISEQFPAAGTIIVKEALGAHAASSLSPAKSRELIRREVAKAVKSAGSAKVEAPCTAPLDVSVRFHKSLYADAAALLPMMKRPDAHTVCFHVDSHAGAIGTISALSLMIAALQ